MQQTKLKLDYCSHKSAKFAVMKWHYSKTMPVGKLVKIGVWENEKFVGCILFGRGANNNIHKMFKSNLTEVCELVRIALRSHTTPVSKLIGIALKMLKKICPGIKVVFSYADWTNQRHLGTVYQASNFKFLHTSSTTAGHVISRGKLIHCRSINAKYGSLKNYPYEYKQPPPQIKILYAHFFDKELMKQFKFKPYPKRLKHSVDALSIQDKEEGSTPIQTLQTEKRAQHG